MRCEEFVRVECQNNGEEGKRIKSLQLTNSTPSIPFSFPLSVIPLFWCMCVSQFTGKETTLMMHATDAPCSFLVLSLFNGETKNATALTQFWFGQNVTWLNKNQNAMINND